MIYQALDSWLVNGLPASSKSGRNIKLSAVHVNCAAPETMHLCQKFGYEIAAVFAFEEQAVLDAFGEDYRFKDILKGLDQESVKLRFRGTQPRIEYYIKECDF